MGSEVEVAASPFTVDEHVRLRAALPDAAQGGYLNAGTCGPVPRASLLAQRMELDAQSANRIPLSWPQHLTGRHEQLREHVARLVGARADQVALTHATHMGINIALWGLDLASGDNVVTTDEEHPGVLVPLRVQADRRGVEQRTVAVDGGRDIVERICGAVDARTRAVVLSHVSWVSGTTLPVAQIASAIGDVPLIVDGAQGAGALPVEFEQSGMAAYTVSGQKWPLGPNTTGALIVREPTAFAPTFASWGLLADFHDVEGGELEQRAQRFELANESFPLMAGLAASLEFLVTDVGVDRAHAHSRYLNAVAREALTTAAAEADVAPLTASGDAHILVVSVPEGSAPGVVEQLVDEGFRIRHLTPSLIRFSLGFWNTADEVRAAVDAAVRAAIGYERQA